MFGLQIFGCTILLLMSGHKKNNFPGPGRYDAARFTINGKAYVGTGWEDLFIRIFGNMIRYLTLGPESGFSKYSKTIYCLFTFAGKGYVGLGANVVAFTMICINMILSQIHVSES